MNYDEALQYLKMNKINEKISNVIKKLTRKLLENGIKFTSRTKPNLTLLTFENNIQLIEEYENIIIKDGIEIIFNEPSTDVEQIFKIIINYLPLKEAASPEELLRANGIKIKSIYGTKFGTEYVLAKQYNDDEIRKILKSFDLKFDGLSIFVIN